LISIPRPHSILNNSRENVTDEMLQTWLIDDNKKAIIGLATNRRAERGSLYHFFIIVSTIKSITLISLLMLLLFPSCILYLDTNANLQEREDMKSYVQLGLIQKNTKTLLPTYLSFLLSFEFKLEILIHWMLSCFF
jgi:hypothetical protein